MNHYIADGDKARVITGKNAKRRACDEIKAAITGPCEVDWKPATTVMRRHGGKKRNQHWDTGRARIVSAKKMEAKTA